METKAKNWSYRIAALIAGTAGVYLAYTGRWVCDDAFISFRYAQQAAFGHGLVFNPGEYVEGYTNFLWTLLFIPVHLLDIDPRDASALFGLVAFLAMFVGAVRFGPALWDGQRAWLILALPFTYHINVFTTSGLETMAFTAAITTGVLLLHKREDGQSVWLAFVALGIGGLIRPDGYLVIFTAASYELFQCWKDRRIWKIVAMVPGATLIVAHIAFRLFYYGDIVPNTFYAKSAADPYPAQGFIYVGLFLGMYWPLTFGIVLAGALQLKSRVTLEKGLLPVVILAWCAYVIWVGGDFMFGRFLVPMVPLMLIWIEREVRNEFEFAKKSARMIAAACLVLTIAGVSILRFDVFQGQPLPMVFGITAEEQIYTRERVEAGREMAERIAPLIRQTETVIAFGGAQAVLVYYLRPARAIEAETGLTDRWIADQELEERGRVGHEKHAPAEYLLERGVHWTMRPLSRADEHAFRKGSMRITGWPVHFAVLQMDREMREAYRSHPDIALEWLKAGDR